MTHTSSTDNPSNIQRRYPRVPLDTPVEIRAGQFVTVGRTNNACLGGLLIHCPGTYEPGREIEVLFNLPTGHSINVRCTIAHTQPDSKFGVRFLDLSEQDRQILSDFLSNLSTYVRRSGRISKRLAVTLRKGEAPEEMAETVVIGRHGGLLVTRARFQMNDNLELRWPDQQQRAKVKIVFSRPTGSAGLQELGFEFEDDRNFWGMNWPEDLSN